MKRLYLKKWLERTITTILVIDTMIGAMMVDSMEIATRTLLIPLAIEIVCSVILLKYGRLGN